MSPSLAKLVLALGYSTLALALPKASPLCQKNLQPDVAEIANTSYVNLVRSAKLPSGTTYRYALSPPFEADMPYLLFLHGFPESSYEWRFQIEYFKEQGYGIIAPDLLGYGGTDNPAGLEAYSYKNMISELGQLLDCEQVDRVIAIGHDFGSPLLSRLISYQPERLIASAFLDIGYSPPGTNLDEASINVLSNLTFNSLGYPIYGYWDYMNDDGAAQAIDSNLDSLFTLMYTYNMTYWRENLAPIGAFEKWTLEGRLAPVGKFISPVQQEQWKAITRAQGGVDGPLKWYKSYMRGINTADEEVLQSSSPSIKHPTLFIGADRDPIGVSSLQLNQTVPFASDIWVRTINAGHFLEVEAPGEVNKHLECFINQVRKYDSVLFMPSEFGNRVNGKMTLQDTSCMVPYDALRRCNLYSLTKQPMNIAVLVDLVSQRMDWDLVSIN